MLAKHYNRLLVLLFSGHGRKFDILLSLCFSFHSQLHCAYVDKPYQFARNWLVAHGNASQSEKTLFVTPSEEAKRSYYVHHLTSHWRNERYVSWTDGIRTVQLTTGYSQAGYSGRSRISWGWGCQPQNKRSINLLFYEIFMKTEWKWTNLDLGAF